MPKAILEFNLPEEQNEFTLATKGHRYYCTLWELDNWLRSKQKHEDKEEVNIEEARTMISEGCNLYEVD